MSKHDWALTVGLALVVGLGSWLFLPLGGGDWVDYFGEAARHWRPAPWAHGLPLLPWAALGLAPLGVLPGRWASAITNAASVLIMVGVLRRYGGRPWLAVPLVVSPLGLWLLRLGQLDLLILAGLLLPAGFDLVLLAAKPQVAAGAGVARLAQAAKRGPRYLAAYLAPLAFVGVASLVIWPGWPAAILAQGQAHTTVGWNVAPWPWGVPVGLVLLGLAWRRADDTLGVLASPLLVPYLNAPTLVASLVMVAARWPRVFWCAWVVMWAQLLWLTLAAFAPAWVVPYTALLALGLALAAGAIWRKRRGALTPRGPTRITAK